LIKTGLLYSVIFLIAVGFFTSPLSFAQSTDDLEKERLLLEKERRIYDESYQNLQQQINSLTSTLSQLQNSGVDDDKLEDIEEQLEELRDDLSDLQETEPSLLDREKSFKEKSPQTQNTSSSEDSETASIPPWFKSNAKWWNQGLISDGDIINALESLIIQDVIPLDNFIKSHPGLEHEAGVPKGGTFVLVYDEPKIPTYQKDVFGFWSDGLVSDSEIVNSIGHLMSQGIINSAKIQGEIAERQAKFDQKMAELDTILDSDSKFMDKIDGDDDSTTVINSDGSKTVTFEDDSITTFFPDGTIITTHPSGITYDPLWNPFTAPRLNDFVLESGLPTVAKMITHPDGTRDFYQFLDATSYESFQFATGLAEGLLITDLKSNSVISVPSSSAGGMEQLSQVTTLTIDGIQFPISQFAIWKWTGECDDAWHYHTPTAQAISADGETGIVDPDQENCGFGKVGEVYVGTWFMSQDEIDKFRDRTDSDPLTNEAMTGGSDDGANPVDVNPGPVSIEESDDSTSSSSESVFPLAPDDWDGDGIPDAIDDEPNMISTTFGTYGGGLPGEIIDTGDLEIKILASEDFGAVSIEVTDDGSIFNEYEDGKEPFVVIQVSGVEMELTPGIYEFTFG